MTHLIIHILAQQDEKLVPCENWSPDPDTIADCFDVGYDEVSINHVQPNGDLPGLPVYVLSITHRHGTNNTVHLTEDGAREELAGYVVDDWEAEGISGHPADFDDPMTMVEHYFDEMSGEEHYDLSAATLR